LEPLLNLVDVLIGHNDWPVVRPNQRVLGVYTTLGRFNAEESKFGKGHAFLHLEEQGIVIGDET